MNNSFSRKPGLWIFTDNLVDLGGDDPRIQFSSVGPICSNQAEDTNRADPVILPANLNISEFLEIGTSDG